ncbi:MAG: sodium:solute symporter family protein [Candidatus Omnitrophica bacterium]|nr:sodium:solute symporter family protein [Candidatus Omnitrophota bacterium]MCM8803234.1 sodium:solute symporter family protein [Candidatus Omnitrophota bacterium]
MIDILIVILYTAGILIFGFYKAKEVKNTEDYLVAGRKATILPLIGTLVMTEFNTATLMGWAKIGYSAGLFGTMVPVIFIVGYGFYTLFASKNWKRVNCISVAEMFEERYGKDVRMIVSIINIFLLLILCSAYLKAASIIFNIAFGLSLNATIIIICLVVLAFTLAGGLVSVIWTDLASFFVTIVTVPILFFIGLKKSGGMEGLKTVYSSNYLGWKVIENWSDPILSTKFIISYSILLTMLYFTAPWYAQRMFAAKDEKHAYYSMAWTTFLTFLLYFLVMAVCAFSKVGWPDLQYEDMSLGLANAINYWVPIGLRGLMVSMIFAVCQTTLSSIWNTNASMIEQDIYVGIFRPNATERERFIFSKIITLILALFTIFGSIYLMKYILAMLFIADVLLTVSFAPAVGAFYFKWANRKGAIASIISTLIVGIITLAAKWGPYGLEHNEWMVLYVSISLPVMFISLFLFSKLTKHGTKELEKINKFYLNLQKK